MEEEFADIVLVVSCFLSQNMNDNIKFVEREACSRHYRFIRNHC